MGGGGGCKNLGIWDSGFEYQYKKTYVSIPMYNTTGFERSMLAASTNLGKYSITFIPNYGGNHRW